MTTRNFFHLIIRPATGYGNDIAIVQLRPALAECTSWADDVAWELLPVLSTCRSMDKFKHG